MKDEEMPILSVVVPVYNNSRELDDLWNCLAGQMTRRTELVLVDDGSRDDGYEKMLQWRGEASFPMTVVHQENRGVSEARNRGMELARGKYLTFIDGDDCVAETYIATLLALAENDMDVVVFDSVRVTDVPRDTGNSMPAPQSFSGSEMLREFLRDPTRFGVCNLLFRRELLTKYDIRFAAGYAYYEDYDFLLQLFPRARDVIRLRKALYYYILREDSAVARFRGARISCLQLMEARGRWLETVAPDFAPEFQKWFTARLYWSVLWQAALALRKYGQFRKFAEITGASGYLRRLKGYPDRLVKLSTWVYFLCSPGYYLAVRLVGRRKSRVSPVSLEEILRELETNGGKA